MIMKMTLFCRIDKRSYDKFRRDRDELFDRRDIINDYGDLILVLLQLGDLYFVLAASF